MEDGAFVDPPGAPHEAIEERGEQRGHVRHDVLNHVWVPHEEVIASLNH